jgi:NAD(P)H-hydrate repair Nnr-like enzyme with NAD(P)H-hydrate dehydratase domain
MKLRMTSGLVLAGMVAAVVSAQTPTPQPYQPSAVLAGSGTPADPFGVSWSWGQGSQASELAHAYVKTDKEETKQEIRKQLNDLLSKQFDENAQRQQKTLEDLEKEIATLRRTLSKRAEHKSDIVNRRLEQLLLDADGLGWNSPNTQGGFGFGGGMGGFGSGAFAPVAKPHR